MKSLERVSEKIAYRFQNEDLLITALSHRSVGKKNNERLEFLGDSVLGAVISEALFNKYPDIDEGRLSRLRSHLVRGVTLAKIARGLELGNWILLGSGEKKSGGHRRDSILAGAFEAIIGAIYLDSDFDTCKKWLLTLYQPFLDNISLEYSFKDPKTQLQEYLQARKLGLPKYVVLSTHGEAHQQEFQVSCTLEELELASQAQGGSRKAAEQAAAQQLLKKLSADQKSSRDG